MGRQNAFYQADITCKKGFLNAETTDKSIFNEWEESVQFYKNRYSDPKAKKAISVCQEDGTWSNMPKCTGMSFSF